MNPSPFLETGGVLARGLSSSRREQCRLLLGGGRGFATDLESIYIPWPLSEDLHNEAFSCAIALQCSPSKELLSQLPLARLSSKEQAALSWVEAGYASAWLHSHWSGLSETLALLSGNVRPNTKELPSTEELLAETLAFSKQGSPQSLPLVFGQLPIVRSAVPGILAKGSQLEARLPWSSKKRLERLNSWSVAIAGEGDQAAAQSGVPNPAEEERVLSQRGAQIGIPYPEWNEFQQYHREDYVSVIERRVANSSLEENQQRELLDSHISAWFTQPIDKRWRGSLEDGVDVDIDQLVDSRIDQFTGGHQSNRFYRDRLPSERDVATLLLIDRSGSLSRGENLKQELQCANALSLAMQESGERYAVYSFWSDTRHHVAIDVWRDFEDHDLPDLSLKRFKPRGYTRLGGAIRHSAFKLRQQSASRYLLLVLGDALPSDEGYEGEYAVADVCKAVEEAEENQVTVAFIAVGNPVSDPVGDALGSHLKRVGDVTNLAPVMADLHARMCG